MKRILYTNHLKLRLKIRNIPEEYPEIIYKEPEQIYYDTAEDTFIAIKNLPYNDRIRSMMIAYEEKKGIVEIITIHPITKEKIINRTMRGRWVEP